MHELTGEVLTKERALRGFTTIAYTLAFILVILVFTRRLGNLTQRVVDFSLKMNIHQPNLDSRDELQILEERFKTLAREIRSETEALEYQASHDPLTELPNRKMLNERLQNELLFNKDKGTPLVLMISDLNHFKEINDTLGHHVGDLVLQQAAERLYNTIRRSDTVARLGVMSSVFFSRIPALNRAAELPKRSMKFSEFRLSPKVITSTWGLVSALLNHPCMVTTLIFLSKEQTSQCITQNAETMATPSMIQNMIRIA